ncbi:MAG TPA: WD40 repeat domain-containing protein [Thermoanaerobaculia bacterium]|nr:WD40 repeat domain-containing protein [Thermoanaerobaculia bacterium]
MAEPLSRPSDSGTVDADNPWPGLASFREADRELFYGRETETQELLRLTQRERLTVFFGLSGLGKTSLLSAGLFPLLRQENVLPVSIRLDFSDEGIRRTLSGQVRQALAAEAEAAGIEVPASPAQETLWESLHRQGAELWSPRNRIVTPLLVFDQFEEVFTLGRGNPARAQEAEAFLTELADLCEGSVPASLRARLETDPSAARQFSFTRHPYKILLSLREDFLPELEGLRGRIRSIVHNRFRLRRMNGDNALRVVTEAGGHLVEPDVPERIVRFVAGRESDEIPLAELDVEPALLSVVCRELNNKRRAQGLPRITAGLVQGNRDEILSDLYERSVEDLGPEVRSFVEDRLLTKSGFRDSVALENAVELPGVTREALDRLTDRRLLRIEDRGGMQRLELTHDVLTGVIRKSRDSRREREARDQEEAARREAEKKLRRSRLALALLGLVLLGVAALAVWGLEAEKKASKALASSALARALALQDSDPAQALAYLARSIREAPENIPTQSLLTDLLLYRRWPQPLAELRRDDAEWVQLSDDGHFFAAGTEGGQRLRIWDTQTLQKVGEIKQPNAIKTIAISRDGRRLLTVSPGTSQLWDIRTGTNLWQIDPEEGEAAPELSQDGRWLAWLRDRQTLVLRDNATRRERVITRGSHLEKCGFSPDSRRIFASEAEQVFLADVASGEPLSTLPLAPASPLLEILFSPDSRFLLVRRHQDTILWDPETQTRKQVGGAALDGWLAPGGARAAAYDSKTLRVWNTGADPPQLLMAIQKPDVYEAEFSPDGRRLLTTAEDGVELWDIDAARRVSESFCDCLHAHFLAGTRRIVTGDDNGVLRTWSLEPTQTATEIYRSSGVIRSSFSQDGSRLAIQTGNGKLHLLDTDAVRLLGEPSDGFVPSSFRLSPNGRFLYEIRADTLHIWDTRNRRPAWPPLRLPELQNASGDYRINPVGGVFGLQSDPGTVELWSLSTGRPLGAAQQSQPITDFGFTPGGDLVITSANNLSIWDTRTGKPRRPAIPHESAVTSFDFSPDGKWIGTGTEYGLVRIWDLRSGKKLVGPLRHRDKIDLVQFDPGGQTLLTRARNLLRLWDPETGRPKSSNIRAGGEIQSAQLGAYGARILIDTVDREAVPPQATVRLLDPRTGQPLVETPVASSSAAQLSASGQILWIAAQNQVHVFAVPHFLKQDRELLARWAEAVGGWAIDENGQLEELSDQLARSEALQRDTANAPPGQLRAASLIRWFLSDPTTRPVSPIFERTLSGDSRSSRK